MKGLALSAPAARSPAPSDGDAQVPGAIGNADSNRTDTLEIGLEFKLDLKSEDLIVLKELGAGNGGTVSKVMHATTRVVMARKIIRVDAKETVRKQILRELQIGQNCDSPYVITYYGAFQNEARDIVLCMEYMDCGSLDRISKEFGPVRVDVLGKITESILGGLVYLYERHRIMHRDIKPSNVLVNSRGNIKLCDFGVAAETVNSIANTFVGTSTYMAPERIQGGTYTIKSDVWSLGLTIMQLAIGRFPFDATDSAAGDRASAGPLGILDLLQQIVHEPAPKLPRSEAFPAILDDVIAKCLLKSPDERPTPRELFDKDLFVQAAKRTPVNLQEWAISMMEKNNRTSYLAPPAPRALNKDGSRDSTILPPPADAFATSPPSHMTPTSGEIPLNISQHDVPYSNNYNSPALPSLEHLSLETPTESRFSPKARNNPPPIYINGNNGPNSAYPSSSHNRYPHRPDPTEPASAIEGPSRPFFGARSHSSNTSAGLTSSSHPSSAGIGSRTIPSNGGINTGGIASAGLSTRHGPPTGPLPVPPTSASMASPRRGQR